MQIEFDPDKRDKTLAERGLDFAQAGEVFAGVNVTAEEVYLRPVGKSLINCCIPDDHMVAY